LRTKYSTLELTDCLTCGASSSRSTDLKTAAAHEWFYAAKRLTGTA